MTVPTRRRPVMGVARAAAFGAIAVAAASCGGGGAAAGVTPGGGAAATAAPSPAGSPSPGVGTVAISGRVVDEAGNAIAGATVEVVTAATIVTRGDAEAPVASATTAADGRYAIGGLSASAATVNGATFIPIVVLAQGHATVHAALYAMGSAPDLTAPRPTTDDLAWLAEINAERQAIGALPPVELDAGYLLAARYGAATAAASGNPCGLTDAQITTYEQSLPLYRAGANSNVQGCAASWQSFEALISGIGGPAYQALSDNPALWIGVGQGAPSGNPSTYSYAVEVADP